MSAKLIYIFDPWCGWCYAAQPLISAGSELLPLKFLHSGLFSGNGKRLVNQQDALTFLQYDRQIASLSGQPFGADYIAAMSETDSSWLDSSTSLTAFAAIEQLQPEQAPALLKALQTCRYINGELEISDQRLTEIIQTLDIDPQRYERFITENHNELEQALLTQQQAVLSLMQITGQSGVPQFILEYAGQLYPIDHRRFLGDPSGWQRKIQTLMKTKQ